MSYINCIYLTPTGDVPSVMQLPNNPMIYSEYDCQSNSPMFLSSTDVVEGNLPLSSAINSEPEHSLYSQPLLDSTHLTVDEFNPADGLMDLQVCASTSNDLKVSDIQHESFSNRVYLPMVTNNTKCNNLSLLTASNYENINSAPEHDLCSSSAIQPSSLIAHNSYHVDGTAVFQMGSSIFNHFTEPTMELHFLSEPDIDISSQRIPESNYTFGAAKILPESMHIYSSKNPCALQLQVQSSISQSSQTEMNDSEMELLIPLNSSKQDMIAVNENNLSDIAPQCLSSLSELSINISSQRVPELNNTFEAAETLPENTHIHPPNNVCVFQSQVPSLFSQSSQTEVDYSDLISLDLNKQDMIAVNEGGLLFDIAPQISDSSMSRTSKAFSVLNAKTYSRKSKTDGSGNPSKSVFDKSDLLSGIEPQSLGLSIESVVTDMPELSVKKDPNKPKTDSFGNPGSKAATMTELLRPLYKYKKGNKCLLCGFESKSSAGHEFRNHLVTHLRDKNFCCDVCGRRFFTSKNLAIHKLIHSEAAETLSKNTYIHSPSNACVLQSQVPSFFSQSSQTEVDNSDLFSLDSSKQDNIAVNADDLLSNIASQNLGLSTSSIQKDISKPNVKIDSSQPKTDILLNSSPQKPSMAKILRPLYKYVKGNKCLLCNFESKSNTAHAVRNHLATHLHNKNFNCDVCEKRFFTSKNLATHKLIHSNKHTFSCDECDKMCVTKFDLSRHKRKHESERKYCCTVCNNEYCKASLLKNHLRVHSGEKPYVCLVCKEAFRTIGMLNNHKKHHNPEEFHCVVCKQRYSSKAQLVEHMHAHKLSA